jgi:hypothetical protein
VKIYVVAVEELRRKERQGETQKTLRCLLLKDFWVSQSFFLTYFFAGFF